MTIQKFKYNGKDRELIVVKDNAQCLEGIELNSIADETFRRRLINDAPILEIMKDETTGADYVHVLNEKTAYEHWKPAMAAWRKFLKAKIEKEDVSSSTV